MITLVIVQCTGGDVSFSSHRTSVHFKPGWTEDSEESSMECDTLLQKALSAPAHCERVTVRALTAALLRRITPARTPGAEPIAADPVLMRCVSQLLAAPTAPTLDEAVRGLTQLIHAGAAPWGPDNRRRGGGASLVVLKACEEVLRAARCALRVAERLSQLPSDALGRRTGLMANRSRSAPREESVVKQGRGRTIQEQDLVRRGVLPLSQSD